MVHVQVRNLFHDSRGIINAPRARGPHPLLVGGDFDLVPAPLLTMPCSAAMEDPLKSYLVKITPITTVWFMIHDTLVKWLHKPTHNWEAPHCWDQLRKK